MHVILIMCAGCPIISYVQNKSKDSSRGKVLGETSRAQGPWRILCELAGMARRGGAKMTPGLVSRGSP